VSRLSSRGHPKRTRLARSFYDFRSKGYSLNSLETSMRSTISLLALTLLATPAVAQAPTPSSTTTVAKTNKTAPPVERPGVTVVAKTKEPALPAQSQPKLPAKSEPKREGLRLMPPKEYDHPYSGAGALVVTHAASQNEVRELCPRAAFPRAGAFGCAQTLPGGCWVVVAPEADMKVVGLTMDITLRHEIAHCNGWPGDHRGALPIEDWALMDPPEEATNTPSKPSAPQQPASRPCGLAIQKPCD
jgi:hypothetical protein